MGPLWLFRLPDPHNACYPFGNQARVHRLRLAVVVKFASAPDPASRAALSPEEAAQIGQASAADQDRAT